MRWSGFVGLLSVMMLAIATPVSAAGLPSAIERCLGLRPNEGLPSGIERRYGLRPNQPLPSGVEQDILRRCEYSSRRDQYERGYGRYEDRYDRRDGRYGDRHDEWDRRPRYRPSYRYEY